MKKFIFFFLTVFLFLGNSQARTESALSNVDIGKSFQKDLSSAELLKVFQVGSVNTSVHVSIEGSNRACKGEIVTLTAQVLGPDTAKYEYAWLRDGQYVYSAAGELGQRYSFKTDTVPVYASYSVVVTYGTGCDPVYSPDFTLTIDETPRTILSGAPICSADEFINLTATTTTTSNLKPYKWVWFKNDTTLVANVLDTTDVHTYAADVAEGFVYVVKALYHQECCNSTSNTLTLMPVAPLDPITLDITDTTICSGALLNITAQDPNDNIVNFGKPTYKWYFNNKLMLGYTDSIFTFAPEALLGVQTDNVIKVVVSYQNNTCEIVERFANVNVVAEPSVEISGSAIYCKGNAIALTANFNDSVVNTIYTYEWRLNNAAVGIGKEYTATQNPSRTPYIYTVVATGERGCTIESAPYIVYVSDSIDALVTKNIDTICPNNPVTFTAQVGGDMLNGKINYVWTDATNTVVGYSRTLEITPTVTGNVVYTVTVTDILTGCTAIGTDSVYVRDLTSTPSIAGITEDVVCEGTQMNLSAVNVPVGLSIQWYKNGVAVAGADRLIYLDTPEKGMNIYGLAVEGCNIVAVYDTVIVSSKPSVVIAGDPIICKDSVVSLVANVNDTISGMTLNYQWRLANENITGATTDTLYRTYPKSDNPYIFSVEVNNGSGCSVISENYYVYINDTPYVAVTVSDTLVCYGGKVTVTGYLGNNYYSSMSYKWYANTDLIDWATGLSFEYPVTEPTVFTLVATDDPASCSGTGISQLVDVFSGLGTSYVEALNVQTGSHQICDGGQVLVTAYMNAGLIDSTLTYVWTKNGFELPGVNGFQFLDSPLSVDSDTTKYIYRAYVNLPGCDAVRNLLGYDSITVFRNPILSIVGDPVVCVGTDNVRLFAYVDGEAMQPLVSKYYWYENGSKIQIPTLKNVLAITRPARHNPYIYTVEYIMPNGCTAMSQEFVLQVEAPPVVNITAEEDTICKGGSTILTANLNDYNEDYLTYQWYRTVEHPDNLIEGATTRTLKVSPDSDFTYYVKVTQTSSKCTAFDYFTLFVNNDPIIDSITIDNNLDDICAGGQVTVNAHISGGVRGDETYTWLRNGTEIANTNLPTFTESLDAFDNDLTIYTYNVIVTQLASGCASIYDPKDDKVVRVKPNVTIDIEGDRIVCDTNTNNVQLIAHISPTTSNGTFTYQWFEDNKAISGATTDTLTLTKEYSERFYNFKVEVTNEYGCSAAYSNIYVSVSDIPVVAITVNEQDICEGGQVTLTAHLNDWTPSDMTYQWYRDSILVDGATSLTYTTTPITDTTHFYFTASKINSGCIGTSKLLYVNTHNVPQIANISMSDTNICTGGQVTVTAHIDPIDAGVPGLPYTYTWYRNGALINGVTGESFTESPAAIDGDNTIYVYSATVRQDRSACNSNETFSAGLNVFDNPIVMIAGDQHICETDTVFLMANVDTNSRPVGILHYTWYETSQIRDNMTDKLGDNQYFSEYYYAYEEPYKFQVEVTRENGCKTRSPEFSVWVYKQPVVNITSTETEICTNGEITMTANLDDYNAKNLTFQWFYMDSVAVETYPAPGVVETVYVKFEQEIPGATMLTYTTTVADTTEYGVRVIQTHSGCEAVDYITINVAERPQIDSISVLIADTICDGAPITMTAHVSKGVAGGEVYQWYVNGFEIEGANLREFTDFPTSVDGESATYVYNVTVRQTAAGCYSDYVDSVAETVVVYPNPTVKIEASSSLAYCEGGEVTLTANVDPIDGNYSYTWYRDNVIVGDQRTYTSKDSARETSYEYHVVVTNAIACNVVSATTFVTVVAHPKVTVTVNEEAICEGGVAIFTAHVEGGIENVNGLGRFEFAWFNNYSTDTLGKEFTYTTKTTDTIGLYDYSVLVTSPYGCQTVATYVGFEIVARPEVAITVAAGYDTKVCDGGSTRLVANVIGGLGEASYQWYKNGNPIDGATFVNYETGALYAGANDEFTVRVVQTGVNCHAISAKFIVPVVPAPIVNITGNANVCVGGTVTLTATVIGLIDNDVATYQWYRIENGGSAIEILGATADVYETSPLTLDKTYSYYVIVTSKISGCTVKSATVQANVLPDPQVVIEGAHSVCEGGELTLNAYVTGGVEGVDYTYTWSWRQNGVTKTETTNLPVFVPQGLTPNDASTPYYFTVTISRTDKTGCDATSPAFEVTVYTIPVTIVTVDNSAVCVGGGITFTANVTPVGTYNYLWYVDGVAQGRNVQEITFNNLTIGDHQIHVVVTPNHANVKCVSTSAPVTVKIAADPIVTIKADVTEMCIGGVANLSVDNIVIDPSVLTGNYTYQWALDGFEINGAIKDKFAHTLATPGTYTYTLKVTQDAGAYGCVSNWSNEVVIVVKAQPEVRIRQASNSLLDICVGGEINLASEITNGTYTNATYEWFASDVQFVGETAANIQKQLDVVGQYNIYVMVTVDGHNCGPVKSNVIIVNVNADPTWSDITLTTLTGDDNICFGERIELSASIQGGVTDAVGNTNGVKQWYYVFANDTNVVDGGVGEVSWDVPDFAGKHNYFVRYSGQLGSGCDLADGIPTMNTINVHALPTASFTGGVNSILCASSIDTTAELEITFTGTPPFYFELHGSDGSVIVRGPINENPYIVKISPNQTTTYSIMRLHDAYCDAAANPVDGSVVSVTVAVSNVNVPNFIVVDCETINDVTPMVSIPVEILSGYPTHFSVSYVDNAYSYLNMVNVGIVKELKNHSLNFEVPATPGDYEVIITIDNCSYYVVIRVPIYNTNDAIFGGEPLVDQRWDDVVVVNNNTAKNGGFTFNDFQWYKNGQIIPGATGPYYQEVGGLNGEYAVALTGRDANGNLIEFVTCAERFVSVSIMKVYPVPAAVNQTVTVEVDLTPEELEGAILDIFDAKGAHVQRINTVLPITKVDGFKAQGAYFGRIITGTNEIKTVKFVIVK